MFARGFKEFCFQQIDMCDIQEKLPYVDSFFGGVETWNITSMLCFSLELTVNPPCQGEIGETFYLLEDLLVGAVKHFFPGQQSTASQEGTAVVSKVYVPGTPAKEVMRPWSFSR